MINISALGPANCVECGAPLAGGKGEPVIFGFGEALVSPSGEVIGEAAGDAVVEVPGLFRCQGCHDLIMAGLASSEVTPSVAFQYLTETFLPRARRLLRAVMTPDAEDRLLELGDAASLAAEALARELIMSGPMQFGGIATITPEDQMGDAELRATLASIVVDGVSATYQCPSCGNRHDVGLLFDVPEMFAGIEDDSKD